MTTEPNHDHAGAPATALFARIGEALYGPQWQCPLARSLDVSDRSVRYWLAGAHPIPHGVWDDLRKIIVDRRRLLSDLSRFCDEPRIVRSLARL